MKVYQCYKRVNADEIVKIDRGQTSRLYLKGGEYADVSMDWMEKNRPQTGGYFVRYSDGYESYSPKAAFEGGYEEFSGKDTLESFLRRCMDRHQNDLVMFAKSGIEVTVRPLGSTDGQKIEFKVDGNYLRKL